MSAGVFAVRVRSGLVVLNVSFVARDPSATLAPSGGGVAML